MGLLQWLSGGSYNNGIKAADEYLKQGGELGASENTMLFVWEDTSVDPREEFIVGWQNREKEEGHGFLWRAFFGG